MGSLVPVAVGLGVSVAVAVLVDALTEGVALTHFTSPVSLANGELVSLVTLQAVKNNDVAPPPIKYRASLLDILR